MARNPSPKEDTWAFQPIGAPFPPNPVKVLGQQNMYVALWYKHGKPIHGRSWNEAGVVECSFPYKKVELKTKEQLEGQIQVLQYTGDHNQQGFWYEWIDYKDRLTKADGRELVRCGDSFPIFWPDSPEGPLLGYVDKKTELAQFSANGKVLEKSGETALGNMKIIMRNFIGGPPNCECPGCSKKAPNAPKVMLNEWMDIRVGDPWPTRTLVKALDKTLDTIPGENPDQYVALWYMAGEPVMGRVWNENGKVAASFAWFNNEYKGNIGSIQLLVQLSEHVRGFDYGWIPFKDAAVFGEKDWHPVHVNHHKGDISPGVITFNGKQILGKCDVRNEKVSAGFGGKENSLVGPAAAAATIVLCRKAKPGYKFD